VSCPIVLFTRDALALHSALMASTYLPVRVSSRAECGSGERVVEVRCVATLTMSRSDGWNRGLSRSRRLGTWESGSMGPDSELKK
jgi:hypothetical protein